MCVCVCVSYYNLTPYISCIQVETVTSNDNDISLCFSLKNQVRFLVLPSNMYFRVKHICSGIFSSIIKQ